jgi:hypothetical protein
VGYPRFSGVGVLQPGGLLGSVWIPVFGWAEHRQRRVPAAGVVNELDAVVDGGGELDPSVQRLQLRSSTRIGPLGAAACTGPGATA